MKKIIFLLIILILLSGCSNSGSKEIKGVTVHFKKPLSWPNDVYIYYYKDEIISAGLWPGVLMNKEAKDWYGYTISEEWYKESKVMFYGDDEHRTPQHMEPGFEVWKIGKGKELWYFNENWYLGNPE